MQGDSGGLGWQSPLSIPRGQAVAKGDNRAALAVLKGLGALASHKPGISDPNVVARQMELDRQDRVDLAVRSRQIADAESKYLRELRRRVEYERVESQPAERQREFMRRAQEEEAAAESRAANRA